MVPRGKPALAARLELTHKLNHHVEDFEPAFLKSHSFDYTNDLDFNVRPQPIYLKKSQVGAAIGVVSLVQAAVTHTEVVGQGEPATALSKVYEPSLKLSHVYKAVLATSEH